MITGTDVRQIREFLGMSRDSFAERIGCSSQLVYFAESGRRGVSPSLRRSIFRVLNSKDFRTLAARMEEIRQELETEFGGQV